MPPLLARLSEARTELSSMEVAALLGTRNVKGIGAALFRTRNTLPAAGIRMDEAPIWRTVRGRSVWTGGPRIRQAMHVLEQEHYRWTGGDGRGDVPIEDARQKDPGPVLVLRALKSRGNVYRIDGGMAELDEILEDDRFEIGDARRESIGEIFVAGIKPGKDGGGHPRPLPFGGRQRLPFLPDEDPETAATRIVDLVKTHIPKRFGFDAMQDIQVQCPMNRGGAGARSLNIELQAALNTAGERKVERFGWTLAPGDKVMQIENDYDKDVYNGDIGLVADVDPKAGELTARFGGRDLVLTRRCGPCGLTLMRRPD